MSKFVVSTVPADGPVSLGPKIRVYAGQVFNGPKALSLVSILSSTV